jgi:hypothetical protein
MIAYEKIMTRIHIIAFFTVADGTFHHSKRLTIYLYPAYIMNAAQTTSPNWLRN